jgi:hypothetical protein
MKTIYKAITASAFLLGSGLALAEPVNLSVAEMDVVTAGSYGFSLPTLSVAGGQGVAQSTGWNAHASTVSSSNVNAYGASNFTAANANGWAAGASSTSLAVLVK